MGAVTLDGTLPTIDTRQDGFGIRRFEQDDNWGRIEILELTPVLSTPAAEQAIRSRASRFITGRAPVVAPLYSIARAESGLTIVTGSPDGVTLADLLAALEFGTATLGEGPLLELAAMIAGALASMHEAGTFAHAALTPAHVLLRPDGTVLLTGAVFGDALQGLQRNREPLWREFGIAMPSSASLPRFDQRSDVTQLGALVLAILLRRALSTDEYPRGVMDLVNHAVDRLNMSGSARNTMRQWLQQALQLQARLLFSSAVDAERAYAAIVEHVSGRRTGAVAVQQVIRQLTGDTQRVHDLPPHPSPPAPPVAGPDAIPDRGRRAAEPARRGFTFMRAVFRT